MSLMLRVNRNLAMSPQETPQEPKHLSNKVEGSEFPISECAMKRDVVILDRPGTHSIETALADHK